eukprot:scaffold7378_cov410-Prasinococcus_capsulatus_cf.AAC.7
MSRPSELHVSRRPRSYSYSAHKTYRTAVCPSHVPLDRAVSGRRYQAHSFAGSAKTYDGAFVHMWAASSHQWRGKISLHSLLLKCVVSSKYRRGMLSWRVVPVSVLTQAPVAFCIVVVVELSVFRVALLWVRLPYRVHRYAT